MFVFLKRLYLIHSQWKNKTWKFCFKAIFIFFCFILFVSNHALAQEPTEKVDSLKIYKEIETYSNKHGFFRFFHRLLFIPVGKDQAEKKAYKNVKKQSYRKFEGKIIRHIKIETLDPFGYSVADSTVKPPDNFVFNASNGLHVKSQRSTIRNLLLIRPNQEFDSLLVKESERLVRTMAYVRDVYFHVEATSANSDSVDIYIRELDKWSIIPDLLFTNGGVSIQLADQNFLGLGHGFTHLYTWYPDINYNAYNVNYVIPNIRNTYISSTIHYGNDRFKTFTKSIALDRPFFSPFTKWAGGIKIMQQYRDDESVFGDSLGVLSEYKFNAQDYWAGSAIQLIEGNTENDRTTNFISALRFLRVRYLELPADLNDSLHNFSDENFYLASAGVSTRKYMEDTYIFNYGITENVPIGQVYGLTGGYQVKNNTGRLYLGARAGLGNYYPWGYLSSNVEYGTFFRASHAEQGVLSGSVTYFTGLLEFGKWKFRQFVRPQFTIGLDRYITDSLTLNAGRGFEGFNSTTLSGSDRIMLTLQSQSYAPWNLIGFRFGPYLTYSVGMLSDQETGFRKSQVFSMLGFGMLIKNLNLVFNTFQISLVYYPSIPGIGNNVFKFNPYFTTDFKFRDFDFSKPSIVPFQ